MDFIWKYLHPKYQDLRALGLNSIVPRGSQRVTVSQLVTAEEASASEVGWHGAKNTCNPPPNHAYHLNQ